MTATSEELRRLPVYGVAMDMCQQLIIRLREEDLFDSCPASEKVYRTAMLDMLNDRQTLERFILHDYAFIRFRDHVRNKKGKVTSCKAYLSNQ